jgi:hypothetical protein
VGGNVRSDDLMVIMTGRMPQLDSACRQNGSASDRLVFAHKYQID